MNILRRKTFIFSLFLIFVIAAFSLIFLGRTLILRYIIFALKENVKFLQDYQVIISNAKGGIFSNLLIPEILVFKGNEKVFFASKVSIDLSVKKILIEIIGNRKPHDINISIYNPTLYKEFWNFIQEINHYVKSKEIGGKKIKIHLKEADITLKDIKEPFIENLFGNFEIDNTGIVFEKVKFNFLNLLFVITGNYKNKGHGLDLVLLSDSSKDFKNKAVIRGNIETGYNFISDVNVLNKYFFKLNGFFSFEGNSFLLNNLSINDVYRIEGRYKYDHKSFSFIVKKYVQEEDFPELEFRNHQFSQIVNLDLDLSAYPAIDLKARIDRLIIGNANFMSNIILEGVMGNKDYIFKGKMYSKGSILNYYPFYEFSCNFFVDKDKVKVEKFILKDVLDSFFLLNLEKPYRMVLKLNTRWLEFDKIIKKYYPRLYLNYRGKSKIKLDMEGEIGNPVISGTLKGRNGIIGDSKFEEIKWNFKGNKNWMEFFDSYIKQEENFYNIYGGVNPAKFNTSEFFNGVRLVSNMKVFSWQGWTFFGTAEGENIELEKNLSRDFKVGFSTYIEKGKEPDSSFADNELELEYSLTEDKSLKLELRDEEEVIGFQHSIKF